MGQHKYTPVGQGGGRLMGKLKVHIDQDKCVGSGQCVFVAPVVFGQREEDGIVELLVDELDESLNADVKSAERLCPTSAIEVRET